MRKISATMATQHPDNAGKPWWNSRAFISTSAEIRECFHCFSDLSMNEYNWDWEGKFVDEAVVDRLLHKHFSFFKKHPLGKDKFLTFRIPNPRVEKQFRLARAFMVIITSSQLAESLGFTDPPIFETILPLTETPEEIIDLQEAFRMLVAVDHKLLKMKDSLQHIEIIPLSEQVDKILNSPTLISRYIELHEKKFGSIPEYLRPYCARSDPALNSGIVPTMLAITYALSAYKELEKKIGIKLYPMVGTGSLPFRGGVTPDTVDETMDKYAGVSTLIIQSAFRYDYSLQSVKSAIGRFNKELQKKKARPISKEQEVGIRKVVPLFTKPYQHAVEVLSPVINSISREVVRRRERVQHIGLFGYSRGIGSVSLPRAIPFTASLYSIGIPPEIIGTGCGIREAKKQGLWKEVVSVYPYLKSDLIRAGYFLNRDNVRRMISYRPELKGLSSDIDEIENELGIHLGPVNANHEEHEKLSEKTFQYWKEKKPLEDLITHSGYLRKSLG